MPRFDLFFVSGLILFLELACIRWVPAHVLYLSFFTNVVLLASFVGMSVGLLTARKPGREIDRTPYLLLGLIAAGLLVDALRGKLLRHTAVGDQARPDVVFFGTETSAIASVEFTVPIELIAGLFFLLTAAVFVGPGQELGRAFNRIPNRTTAYALDLLGSLTGIALFALCSTMQTPPVVWFGAVALALEYLLRQGGDRTAAPIRSGGNLVLPLVLAVGATTYSSGLWVQSGEHAVTVWSPYYRVDYNPRNSFITTNLIGHQQMFPLVPRSEPTSIRYELPYLLRGAAGLPAPKRILIIGSGSGNDLARATRWCPADSRIDAVEIDPVIRQIGRAAHPDMPYFDPRITSYLNDGRNFLRMAPDAEYDLVIFALVDSLVLHSGYSNLRLESYLFTQESFRDVARVLKPDGTAAIYNFFRQGWIVARIRDQLHTAFGAAPLVYTSPVLPGNHVPLDTTETISGFTLCFAARPDVIQRMRDGYAKGGGNLWVAAPGGEGQPAGVSFRQEKPPGERVWFPINPATVAESEGMIPATDDWPFLYVRQPDMPGLTVRGIGLTIVLSFVLWRMFRPKPLPASGDNVPPAGLIKSLQPLDVRAFLLGAGFMLIETKAVVQMALLFGSTWTVNTSVFAAVLVMALAGNLFAGWVKPANLTPYYIGLMIALGANILVSPDSFLGMDPTTQILTSCSLVFAPILFAGVIFPVSFARAEQPDRFFGANVAGALAGGLMENLSLLLGFQLLLLVAVGLYGLSSLFGRPGSEPTRKVEGYN